MKIIETGTPPENKTYRITCSACFTIFEIQKREAKLSPVAFNNDWIINCPICGRECHFSTDEKSR